MGMFDTVMCEHPVPGPAAINGEYQTKSLGCEMATYRIAADGQLYIDEPGWYSWATGSAAADATPALAALTGEIRLLGAVKQYPDDPKWVRYSAYFVGGKLKELHEIRREA